MINPRKPDTLTDSVDMSSGDEVWLPGSFTKNFSWGQIKDGRGLVQLHAEIQNGFDNRMEDVPRKTFRQRVSDAVSRTIFP